MNAVDLLHWFLSAGTDDRGTKMEKRYELKLDTGKVVEWVGRSGENTAVRYVDCKGGAVVAWREPQYVFVAGVSPDQIQG